MFDATLRTVQMLKKLQLFSQENCNLVTNHPDSCKLVEGLSYLHHYQFFTPENFRLVVQHQNLGSLVSVLYALHTAHERFRGSFIQGPHFGHNIPCPNLEGIFNKENFLVIAQSNTPFLLYRALGELKDFGVLTPDIRAQVTNHTRLEELAEAVRLLSLGRLKRNLGHVEAMLKHSDPVGFAKALVYLARERQHLNEEDIKILNKIYTALAQPTTTNPLETAQDAIGLLYAQMVQRLNDGESSTSTPGIGFFETSAKPNDHRDSLALSPPVTPRA